MQSSNVDTALLAFKYLAEGHKAGSFDNYLDMLTDDFVFYAPAGEFRGKNVGKERARQFYNAITNAKADFTFSEPLRIATSGSTVVIEFTDEGTIMGQPYFNRIASSFDIRDGKIAEYREYFGDVDVNALSQMQGGQMANPNKMNTQTLIDKIEIQELSAKYCWAVDTGNADAYIQAWHPEGVSEAAYGSAKGHAELRTRFQQMQNGLSKDKRHIVANAVIEINGTDAKQQCYLLVLDRLTATVISTAIYHDELVKTSEGWKLKKRAITIDPGWKPGSEVKVNSIHQ